MVSAIHSSISSLLAASYSPYGQISTAQQLRADEIAAKERLQTEETLKLQTTVQPVSRDGRSPYQGAFVGLDQRDPQTLRDLERPKAELSPSDEVQIFGLVMESETPEPAADTGATLFEQGSDGVFYAVNDNADQAAAQTDARRQQHLYQQKIADLYQRNHNARFDTGPAYAIAA